MKKNLVIFAVLFLYVVLCGCPYQYGSMPPMPFSSPITIGPNLINQSINGNLGMTLQYPVTVNFTNANTFTIQDVKKIFPLESYNCSFGLININVNGKIIQDTVMDLIADGPPSPTNTQYFVVLKAINDASGNMIINFLPLPSDMTIAPGIAMEAAITTYLTDVENGRFINGTDKGYDPTTEIKNATVLPILGLATPPADSVIKEVRIIPKENGSIHLTRPMKILITIFAFILGIIVGYMIKRKKRR